MPWHFTFSPLQTILEHICYGNEKPIADSILLNLSAKPGINFNLKKDLQAGIV